MAEIRGEPPDLALRDGSRLLDRTDLLTCAVLGVCFFALNLVLAVQFRNHFLLDYGALFQADPDKWIPALAHGNGVPTFRHPLFMLVIHPIFLGLGLLITAISPATGSAEVVRETLAVLLAPLFSGLKAATLFALFKVMFSNYRTSMLMSLLGMLSFSQMVFGSVPDHMGISGALLTILFLQGALAIGDTRFDKTWIWTLIGIASIGVTVSNAVAFAIVFGCVRLTNKDPARETIIHTGIFTSILILIPVLFAFSMAPFFEYTGRYPSFEKTLDFIHKNPNVVMTKAKRFPLNIFYTVVAPTPDSYDSDFAERTGAPFTKVFTVLDHRISMFIFLSSIAALAIVIGGSVFWYRSGSDFQALSVAAVLILGFNWLLHSFWGTGLYYYSQHWHTALMVITVGWFWDSRISSRIGYIISFSILCIFVFRNYNVLRHILDEMSILVSQ